MYFFDIGVRNVSAGLRASMETVLANPGHLFEQWVGIELWKRIKYSGEGKLLYLRASSGSMEIDFIFEYADKLIPLEVKWTDHPIAGDAKNIERFISEHKKAVDKGFVVCCCNMPVELSKNVIAIPWHCL